MRFDMVQNQIGERDIIKGMSCSALCVEDCASTP